MAPKVSYTAMRRHDYGKAFDQFTLESFLSDDAAILTLFKNEVAQCMAACDSNDSRHTPDGFHAFIREQFAAFGVAAAFDAALGLLMDSEAFQFH